MYFYANRDNWKMLQCRLHHAHAKLLSYVAIAIAVTISLVEIILPLDIGNRVLTLHLQQATHATCAFTNTSFWLL